MWLLLFLFLRSSILYSLHIHVYSFIQYTLFWFIKKTQRSKDHTTWKGPLESHVSPSIQLLGLESRVPGPEVAAIIYIYIYIRFLLLDTNLPKPSKNRFLLRPADAFTFRTAESVVFFVGSYLGPWISRCPHKDRFKEEF